MALRRIYLRKLRQRSALLQHPRRSRCLYAAHIPGDFRANVALGASVEPYPVTSGIRTIAADIYEQTGLDFLGIDLLFGREKPYFCEINVMPGLEGIEKASGINVAGKIIETIQSDFTSKT